MGMSPPLPTHPVSSSDIDSLATCFPGQACHVQHQLIAVQAHSKEIGTLKISIKLYHINGCNVLTHVTMAAIWLM